MLASFQPCGTVLYDSDNEISFVSEGVIVLAVSLSIFALTESGPEAFDTFRLSKMFFTSVSDIVISFKIEFVFRSIISGRIALLVSRSEYVANALLNASALSIFLNSVSSFSVFKIGGIVVLGILPKNCFVKCHHCLGLISVEFDSFSANLSL